ncbi:hypothetical protein LXL04_011166 [Taraxacum kok-saghyz]
MKGKRKSLDRISFLPQGTVEKILTHMPIRDALRTSILSTKWKYFWRSIPKLVFNKTMVVSCDNDELYKYKFLNAIFHVLMLRTAPILEFSLFVDTDIFANEMVCQFLTNCPLLEEFTWNNCYNDIYITECELVELLKCIPSVQVLKIYQMNTKHLGAGSMPRKLPVTLPHLRTLVLKVCFYELSTVLCMISSFPNLEKIMIVCLDRCGWCYDHTFKTMLDPQDYSFLKLDHLKEMEIIGFQNYDIEVEFVKLIMAKSPVLKKAQIELNFDVSHDVEDQMVRYLLHKPFPCASPAASLTCKQLYRDYMHSPRKLH